MDPIFPADVSPDGKLQFPGPVRGLLARHLRQLAGKPVDVVVKPHRRQRTNRQGRYYFGVVVPLIGEHCGYDKQEMHELLAMRFLRMEDDPVTGSPRRRRTPDTSTTDFVAYVEQCVRFAADLGVYVPEPGAVAA